MANSPRYTVAPIANADCNSLDLSGDLHHTNRHWKAGAWILENHSPGAFGSGILDRRTGKIDVGFGFGVPCPDFNSDA